MPTGSTTSATRCAHRGEDRGGRRAAMEPGTDGLGDVTVGKHRQSHEDHRGEVVEVLPDVEGDDVVERRGHGDTERTGPWNQQQHRYRQLHDDGHRDGQHGGGTGVGQRGQAPRRQSLVGVEHRARRGGIQERRVQLREGGERVERHEHQPHRRRQPGPGPVTQQRDQHGDGEGGRQQPVVAEHRCLEPRRHQHQCGDARPGRAGHGPPGQHERAHAERRSTAARRHRRGRRVADDVCHDRQSDQQGEPWRRGGLADTVDAAVAARPAGLASVLQGHPAPTRWSTAARRYRTSDPPAATRRAHSLGSSPHRPNAHEEPSSMIRTTGARPRPSTELGGTGA